MLLQTILNRVHKIKGFVYGAVRQGEGAGDPTLEVEVRPRAEGKSETTLHYQWYLAGWAKRRVERRWRRRFTRAGTW